MWTPLGPEEIVLIREVSQFQGLNNTIMFVLDWDQTKCPVYKFRVSMFRGSTVYLLWFQEIKA